MADEKRKTRSIGDLRSRLGKGKGAPLTGGEAPAAGPGGASHVVPPPSMRGTSGGNRRSIPGPSVMPPPFARSGGAGTASADTFSATHAAPQGPREVRLVVDDKPVADSEVGRKRRLQTLVGAAVVAVVGIGLGWFGGSTASNRSLYRTVIRDAAAMHGAVEKAAPTLEKAQGRINDALAAASPTDGSEPKVDFEAIEGLLALKRPLDASAFARRHYKALKPETVDALFEYYNGINILWSDFRTLVSRTRRNKDELAQAASAATKLQHENYGCLLKKTGDAMTCTLGTVRVGPGEGTPSAVTFVSSSGRPAEKKVFSGNASDAAGQAVIIDKWSSRGILGRQASAFGTYLAQLRDADKLIKKTSQLQGHLLQELGQVKNLQ